MAGVQHLALLWAENTAQVQVGVGLGWLVRVSKVQTLPPMIKT